MLITGFTLTGTLFVTSFFAVSVFVNVVSSGLYGTIGAGLTSCGLITPKIDAVTVPTSNGFSFGSTLA